MTNQALIISALFLTSILVRVVPSLVDVKLPANCHRFLNGPLPKAVFITFAVYIFYIESANVLALLIVGVFAVFALPGLVFTTLVGCTVAALL